MYGRAAEMLRQAVVLGGRAVIPAAMGLVLASPGFARAADHGATSPVASVTRALAAAAAAPVIDSAFHAGDPVSHREEGPGHDRGDDRDSDVDLEPAAPEGGTVAGDGPAGPAAAAPASDTSSLPAQSGGGPDAPASDSSSLPAQSGAGPPARIAIADALRLSSPLPVITIDGPGRGPLTSVSGRLQLTRAALRVEIALRRGGPRQGCAWWTASHARFAPASRAACGKPRWIRATLRPRTGGGWRWRARLGGPVPRAPRALLVRVLDGQGRPLDVERR